MIQEILRQRLRNQQIHAPFVRTPAELVAWMGAMQAQDYEMSKWAIGVRLPNHTEGDIESALNNGEILRTHILRPTWHLVSPTDIRWMLELSRPQIERIVAGYNQRAGLDFSICEQANKTIEKALTEQPNLTRTELMQIIINQGIITSDMRGVDILFMFHAELTGLVCSGERKGKQITYALLDERAPLSAPIHRDEALGKLAKVYFQSHSPATMKDFSWWSGLSITESRKAIEHIKEQLETFTIDKTVYYVLPSKAIEIEAKAIHLLPAFDEYMVSYADRTAALSAEFTKQAITSNGIFSPIIVHKGKVIGIWKRKQKPKFVEIDIQLFEPISMDLKLEIKDSFKHYQNYWGGLDLRFLEF